METLIKVQPQFKETLLTNVATYLHDTEQFYKDYAEVCPVATIIKVINIIFVMQSGPMVEGIHPREASDRLNLFQAQFDDLWRWFQTYSDGEELFGLPVTDHPELKRIRKELNLLQKLYGLYNLVMDSIDGYYDILWTEASTT